MGGLKVSKKELRFPVHVCVGVGGRGRYKTRDSGRKKLGGK